MSDEITKRPPMEMSVGGLRPASLEDAMRLAKLLSDSTFVPQSYQGHPGNVLAAMLMGAELGLAPMVALRHIAVINGRPSLWGDGMLAIVVGRADCEDVVESFTGDAGKDGVATCTVKRRGRAAVTRSFTTEDAKRAGLLGKKGPWQEYTARMLQLRARGFALRDAFPDALTGLTMGEEALDLPPAMIDATPAAAPGPSPTAPGTGNAKLKAALTETGAPQESVKARSEREALEAGREPDVVAEMVAFIGECASAEEIDGADWSMAKLLSKSARAEVAAAIKARKAELAAQAAPAEDAAQ